MTTHTKNTKCPAACGPRSEAQQYVQCFGYTLIKQRKSKYRKTLSGERRQQQGNKIIKNDKDLQGKQHVRGSRWERRKTGQRIGEMGTYDKREEPRHGQQHKNLWPGTEWQGFTKSNCLLLGSEMQSFISSNLITNDLFLALENKFYWMFLYKRSFAFLLFFYNSTRSAHVQLIFIPFLNAFFPLLVEHN